jgi:hypothetical protein
VLLRSLSNRISHANVDFNTFDPPGDIGENYTDTDWVLVLDDAARDYPQPGVVK